MNGDERWMLHAIELAKRAEQQGEVPVGAVLVEDDKIIAEGWNRPISSNDPTAHAEIEALRMAAASTGNYRLPGKTLYVTLEPCVMCCGAIFHARISRVVFGAYDPKAGAAASVINLFTEQRLNHHAQVEGGILEQECVIMLSQFFKGRR
jgi:tRNA(adenine34) deaminase